MTIFQTIEVAVAGRVLRAPDALVRRVTGRRWEVDGAPLERTIPYVGRKKPALQSGCGLDAKTTRWFFMNYTTAAGDGDPRLAPLLFASHRGLSPAIVATAQFDLLCGEGPDYVAKLEAADVPVTHLHFADLPHDFATMSVLPRAREAIAEIADSLRRALHG